MSDLGKISIGIAVTAIIIAAIVMVMISSSPSFVASDESKTVNDTPVGKYTFHISTVHVDGKTNINGDDSHPPESFPDNELPSGGGYALTSPDGNGDWKVRVFEFSPSQIVVRQGDKITLDFLGVQGSRHAISVDGHAEEFELGRGELKSVTFTADDVGTVNYSCSLHQPTMQGHIIILPRE